MKRKWFFDMDGTLAAWNTVSSEEELYEKGYYRNLEPMLHVVRAMKEISASDDVYILSSYLNDSPYALSEKKEWIEKYCSFMKKENCIFVPNGENKAEMVCNVFNRQELGQDWILVDDYNKNLKEWHQASGIAIKILNGVNSARGEWLHDSVYYMQLKETVSKSLQNAVENQCKTQRNLYEIVMKHSDKHFKIYNEIQLKEMLFETWRGYASPNSDIDIINDIVRDEVRAVMGGEKNQLYFIGECLGLIKNFDLLHRLNDLLEADEMVRCNLNEVDLSEEWNEIGIYNMSSKELFSFVHDFNAYAEVMNLYRDILTQQELQATEELGL
ncbi:MULTISPECIES: hypothetical protein [unclassified Breznakia]|uniref:5' nucleotidase, NT5C type n=1 Tax=unclassified Breznakia TaxID=2623764 RepID=UPI0024738CE1|nr:MULTISPECIES: hypothetical protein [unclassified Breznakia]MDH6367374.1 hypothetical protein [Breznakia sp. PH1-1]MDH6403906.1 hypothetical protein [Breznakia sp. PF1-11]MDH6411615.1 hypothetical protein [Breznakia sp. PFB1-11]MDH6414541.1 hypothetical protein [Breznakia sp. PFB1-14]MDH6418647.1 hypothetical protein [Breznakia sp. PFB1-12]